jgi:hypothetical protein
MKFLEVIEVIKQYDKHRALDKVSIDVILFDHFYYFQKFHNVVLKFSLSG